jgi:hypothetical protein
MVPPFEARGAALVERIIGALPTGKPRHPVAEAQLATLRFPGGEPLPPSLRRWLAFDAEHPRLVGLPDRPAFEPLSFAELLEQEFGRGASRGWDTIIAALPGDCFLLPGGADTRCFLYVGRADALGEYPVLVVDTDDLPFVSIACPGFDAWLAVDAGVFQRARGKSFFDHPTLGPAMAELAMLNLGGRRALDEGGEGPSFLPGIPLQVARVKRGINPFTKQAVEVEVHEPVPGAVPPVQAPGFALRRAAGRRA